MVSTSCSTEQSTIPAQNEKVTSLHALAQRKSATFDECVLSGHTATQVLLASRYHDLVIMSDNPIFADRDGTGPRRVNPLVEILDQAVVPTILCGESAALDIGPAALYFDGSPFATVALHQLAYLYQSTPNTQVTVRVSGFEKPIVENLANEAAQYLKVKGLTNVETETSCESPIELVQSYENDKIDMVALGIRSRQAYHDFRMGVLASHFLKNEPNKNKLFCQ